MKTTAIKFLFIMCLGMFQLYSNAQNVTINADYSNIAGPTLRTGFDHNITNALVNEYQKKTYQSTGVRMIRRFVSISSFYNGTQLKSKAELDAFFLSKFDNYARISETSQKLLFVIKNSPTWMGADDTYNYDALEASMKEVLKYLKQTFIKFEYLECWNEPDLNDPAQGLPNGAETFENYNKIYERFEKAVNYVNANVSNGAKIKIGGPVTCYYNSSFIEGFLNNVKAKNLKCDFIAWHTYSKFGNDIYNHVTDCKSKLASRGMKAEIVISEFGEFPGGHGVNISADDFAKQAAAVADQTYGFIRGGGDILMTWVLEHPSNERKNQTIYNAGVSNNLVGWQTYDFPDVNARYFYLTFYANAAKENTVVKEIQILDDQNNIIPLTKVKGNANLVDGSESTIWTSTTTGYQAGRGEHAFSATAIRKVSKIKICWGGTGSYRFDLSVSENSSQWHRALDKDYPTPSCHLLTMQAKLGSTRINTTTTTTKVNALATYSDTSLAIMCISRDDYSSFNVTLNLTNIPATFLNKNLRIKRYLADGTHSNFGYNKSKYALETVSDSITTTTGSLKLIFPMTKNAVSFIEIIPTGNIVIPTYSLTVNSGTGSGNYAYGKTVSIAANTPPAGKIFDQWTGATTGINDVLSSSTTITMPGANTSITATYKTAPVNTYTLTVTGGTGSGSYVAGTSVNISAIVPSGKIFDKWTGTGITNINASSTTLIMPATNITIMATYKTAPVINYSLTVTGGTGSGSYAAGAIVSISAAAPPAGKTFDKWIGATSGITDISSPNTTYKMSASNAGIAATYKDLNTMNEVEKDEAFSFYPNPAKDWIHFKNAALVKNIVICNISGMELVMARINADVTCININHLASGIYILKIVYSDDDTESKCFFKE